MHENDCWSKDLIQINRRAEQLVMDATAKRDSINDEIQHRPLKQATPIDPLRKYTLTGLILYEGNGESGHYWSFTRHGVCGNWYKQDDSAVQCIGSTAQLIEEVANARRQCRTGQIIVEKALLYSNE